MKHSGLAAGVVVLFCCTGLWAQRDLRDLQGTVRDRHHEPLKGAVVEVENENTHTVSSYITDQSGRYSFKRLQGNTDYRVWSTYRGQRSKPKTLSLFDTKRTKTFDLTVRVR